MFPKTTIVQIVKLRQKDNLVILSKRMVVYDVTPEANPLRQFLLSRLWWQHMNQHCMFCVQWVEWLVIVLILALGHAVCERLGGCV